MINPNKFSDSLNFCWTRILNGHFDKIQTTIKVCSLLTEHGRLRHHRTTRASTSPFSVTEARWPLNGRETKQTWLLLPTHPPLSWHVYLPFFPLSHYPLTSTPSQPIQNHYIDNFPHMRLIPPPPPPPFSLFYLFRWLQDKASIVYGFSCPAGLCCSCCFGP